MDKSAINPDTGKAYAVNPATGNWDDNYFASNFGGSSGGGGGGTPRLDFVKGLTDTFKTENAALQGKVDTARTGLIDYYKGLEDPTTRFNRIAGEQGLTEQQNLVNSLTKNVMQNQDLVEAIEPSVNARSGDFFVNDAQRTAIIARERAPIEQNLTKLLRSKEYAEIGLQGKQQFVSQLLQLAQQGDEQKARPLQLGVDYSTADRDAAREIFSNIILPSQSGAFTSDQDAADAVRAAEAQRQFQIAEAEKERSFQKSRDESSFANAITMENLSSENQLNSSLALKGFDVANRTSGGGSSKSSKEAEKAQKQATEDAWNKIVAGAKTEYDVWKAIDKNKDALGKSGVNVQGLWSKHAALAAKTGTGGAIRSSSKGATSSKLEEFKKAAAGI